MINGLLTLLVILFAGIGGGAVWYERQLDVAGPLKAPANFVVKRGEGARDIAKRLEESGIISSQHLFIGKYVTHAFGRTFGGKGLNLQAGEYIFEAGSSVRQVVNILSEGRTALIGVTIPEGLTSQQVVDRLNGMEVLTGKITQVPPEGSLMPDTYRVPRSMDRNKVIEMMQSMMSKFLADAWEKRREGLPVRTPQEAVVLASIVEKETGRRDERAQVAGVFSNRLTKGMRLQSDPTILYGVDGGKVRWGRPIYRSEINRKTAHNTYQIDGLPPTPICNPGRAAIEAVLNPASTTDLYFVADGKGGHIFSETLKEHNAAVANWRRIERELAARKTSQPTASSAEGDQPKGLPTVVNAPETVKALAAGAAYTVPLPTRKPRSARASQ
jgi:UPF0755 protein